MRNYRNSQYKLVEEVRHRLVDVKVDVKVVDDWAACVTTGLDAVRPCITLKGIGQRL